MMKLCTVLKVREGGITGNVIHEAELLEISLVEDDHEFGWRGDELHYEGRASPVSHGRA